MSFFRSNFENRHCHISQPRGRTLHSSPGPSGFPASRRAIDPLSFLMEEAADQPVCPVLPNTGPKPLRPLLKPHLVAALIRATPKFKFLLGFWRSRASLC
jgi:hypothetical protein